MHQLSYLIAHFGYMGIIIALIGGIIGLPIPDEVLLTYVGYNVFQGNLSFIPSLLCAAIGACGGISLSYLIGIKLGMPFLKKYGPKLHITEQRVNRTKKLFTKMGPLLLFIGFFIPGIRHITAYLAGINGYTYKKFALFAYSGALIWGFTFITLGKMLGENWTAVGSNFSRYSTFLIILFILVTVVFYMYRRKRRVGLRTP